MLSHRLAAISRSRAHLEIEMEAARTRLRIAIPSHLAKSEDSERKATIAVDRFLVSKLGPHVSIAGDSFLSWTRTGRIFSFWNRQGGIGEFWKGRLTPYGLGWVLDCRLDGQRSHGAALIVLQSMQWMFRCFFVLSSLVLVAFAARRTEFVHQVLPTLAMLWAFWWGMERFLFSRLRPQLSEETELVARRLEEVFGQ